jgi:hypothetical protein
VLSSSRSSEFWTVLVYQEVVAAVDDVLDVEAMEEPVTVGQSPRSP